MADIKDSSSFQNDLLFWIMNRVSAKNISTEI
uniref:Transcriptional regulator n=1 Tax=Heterorhabditis bacteriophora TaxID=37862 RepID=A0A1I7XTA9_HETBA